jgi:glyoxylase-like metal-dependent hydrolase (beta-lactamase superfamily II)
MLKLSQYGDVTRIDSARTIAGRGYYWSTAYLVNGLLIDSGCAHSASELIRALEGKEIVSIVNTHTHEDHIGANGTLQDKRNGLKVFAHPLALPVLANPREAQPLQIYRRVMWGWPMPSKGKALADGEVIETGKYAFQVIYTPGHSPDHICLFEQKQGWLFSGDLYVGGKDRALREGYDIWQIIASLKRIAALPLRILYPGCARVRDNPAEVLAYKIQYLEEMGEQVVALHHQGKPEKTIFRSLMGGPMWIELITAGHFSRRHLVRSYLGAEEL